MAKGGSSGGKAGGTAYAGPASGGKYGGSPGYGKKGSSALYGMGAKTPMVGKYSPNYGADKLMGAYLKHTTGIAKIDSARKSGQDFDKGYQSDLGHYGTMAELRKKGDDDDISRCSMCGGPIPQGSAYCMRCITQMN